MLEMNQRERNESIIKRDFGGARGIYIIHCASPEECPCQDFYECLGVYKLLGWRMWIEWRKGNCIFQGSVTDLFCDERFRKIFSYITLKTML